MPIRMNGISILEDKVDSLWAPLPAGTIRFRIGSEDWNYIDISLGERGELVVRGGLSLTISPEAGNTIRLTGKRML